jgi:hypothetical protein
VAIFTSKKYGHTMPSHSAAEVPFVLKQECLLVDTASDRFISLFRVETGETKDDVNAPLEMSERS